MANNKFRIIIAFNRFQTPVFVDRLHNRNVVGLTVLEERDEYEISRLREVGRGHQALLLTRARHLVDPFWPPNLLEDVVCQFSTPKVCKT